MSLWDCWKSYPNWSANKQTKYLLQTLFTFLDLEDAEEMQWMLNNTLQLKKRGRPSKHDSATTLKNARNMMGKLISHDKVRGNMQAYLDDIGNKEGRDKCSVYSFYLSRQRVRLNRDPVIKFWNEVQAIYASKAEEVKQRK